MICAAILPLKENLYWWLIEEPGQARDQFALRYADMTEILWNEGKKKAETHFRKKVPGSAGGPSPNVTLFH